jgi:hypothetical protein
MKRIAFVLLVLILPAIGFAQSKKALSHFWDIPWGTSIEKAEAIFNERGFTSFREGASLMTQTRYEGEEAVIMLLFNKTNRLYSGNVIYSGSERGSIPKYENYRKVLFRRYGMPDTAVEYFTEPYKKGDGREIEAIGNENAFYYTEWKFQDSNVASLSILKNLDVCMSFNSPVYTDSTVGRR